MITISIEPGQSVAVPITRDAIIEPIGAEHGISSYDVDGKITST